MAGRKACGIQMLRALFGIDTYVHYLGFSGKTRKLSFLWVTIGKLVWLEKYYLSLVTGLNYLSYSTEARDEY